MERAFDMGRHHPCGSGSPTISVIVPALNEARNLPYFFSRLPPDLHEVVLVDGGSVDGTVDIAQELYPKLVAVEQTRSGKGNALACGFAASTGDILVTVDADGSTDPAEIPSFVDALVGGADYAKGSRFRPGGESHDITRLRRIGNHGLGGVVNLLFGTEFTDLCYGYNAFWRHVLDCLELPDVALESPAGGDKLWGDGFEIETLITVRAARHRLRVSEVASVEARRLHGVSNLNAISDGIRVMRTIIREYRRPRATPAIPTLRRTVEGRRPADVAPVED
jgi:glycosyltransferase involved in cell wall biosynthesis